MQRFLLFLDYSIDPKFTLLNELANSTFLCGVYVANLSY